MLLTEQRATIDLTDGLLANAESNQESITAELYAAVRWSVNSGTTWWKLGSKGSKKAPGTLRYLRSTTTKHFAANGGKQMDDY